MDKKQALQILVKNSQIIDDNGKLRILGRIEKMPEERIDSLGEFLTMEFLTKITADYSELKITSRSILNQT